MKMNDKQKEALKLYRKMMRLEKQLQQTKEELLNSLEYVGSRYDGVICHSSVILHDGTVLLTAEDYYDCFDGGDKCCFVDIEDYIKNVQ